jgi:hypothetical protein
MPKRIVYPDDFGGVAIVVPSPDCPLTVEQIAAQVVPEGKPFKIIDTAAIPADRSDRDSWTYEMFSA